MKKLDLKALLERVRNATGPDRGLDGLLARDVEGWIPHFALEGEDIIDWPWMGGHWHLPGDPDADDCQQAPSDEPPAYTASIDAALALVERVLPGWQWCLNRLGRPMALVNNGPGVQFECERAETMPLAILTSLLLALTSNQEGNDEA